MTRRRLGFALLRLVVAYAALCAGTSWFGAPLLRGLSPIFKLELEAAHPDHRVDALTIERDTVTVSVSSVARHGRGFEAQASPAPAFTYPILVLSLLAAWPFGSSRQRWLAIGVASTALLVVLAVDLPASILLAVDEATQTKEPFVLYLFNNGGRQFLSLIILVLALAAAHLSAGAARVRRALG